ncbi:ligase-associated DNA damage response DEXH box helicase [Stenotrophomonas nitritireducens]|uniref:ligase-associated DNA damage response DEXH box helicase n=1 Tax=Stenotrophomonas nitritireducens TaxID=83617 RepID=UPI003D95E25E
MTPRQAQAALGAWFAGRGWTPLPFQRAMWRHYLAGESGLLLTPTGSGKTLAVYGGPLLEALQERPPPRRRGSARPLQVLWVTPLRALAGDTALALRAPLPALGLDWQVGLRTGDAAAGERRRALEGRLDVLVTTPESLSLLLSHAPTLEHMRRLRCIVVDEWHELLASKRGVLLQLDLLRLREAAPQARTWGLSATLGNPQEACQALLPDLPQAKLVRGARARPVRVTTLLPAPGERFPWAGHLGLAQLPRVLEALLAARSSLLFTNTRAQAELWHQALASVWPDDPAALALHHGSLDPALRRQVEDGLRAGTLRCVVATSSLDLGVDFPAVDQVLQLGSPKGIARLRQRAGRARHRPGASGSVVCVPTHALETVEYAAARHALRAGVIEARLPPRLCLDVLAQHCVSCALGGGFRAGELLARVRRSPSFAALDESLWQAVLDFIVHGGAALGRYPDFQRVSLDADGVYRVHDRRIARRHRLSIGTISSDGSVRVRFLRGGELGAVEEQFAGRLRPGQRFHFAGRLLELVRLRDMVAYVRAAHGPSATVPRWQGGQLPLSEPLGREVAALLAAPDASAEMRWLRPLLALQTGLSALPSPTHLLLEQVQRRDGQYLFCYPFAGRRIHEALATLLALRLSRQARNSIGYAVTDLGLVLAPERPLQLEPARLHALFSTEAVEADLREAVNLAELARRQFRGIARTAGLLVPAPPGGAPRSLRQLQASSGLLYDVLREHDPGHLLLAQAEREALDEALDLPGLLRTLHDCAHRRVELRHPPTLTPLAFPLWAERLRGKLSNETWRERVLRAAAQLERRHGR